MPQLGDVDLAIIRERGDALHEITRPVVRSIWSSPAPLLEGSPQSGDQAQWTGSVEHPSKLQTAGTSAWEPLPVMLKQPSSLGPLPVSD